MLKYIHKKNLLFIVVVLLHSVISAQNKFTISGTVKAGETGETLIKASIRVGEANEGTTTNEYGFYSITLPKGVHTLYYSAIGYQELEVKVNLNKDTVQNIKLNIESQVLEDVTVEVNNKRRSISSTQMGMERLNMSDIKNVPMLLGERDVIKALQLLPGVKSAGDGNSGFYVRGGSADQNLILLDEATVYNASHLMGFFSTFNSDAIKDVTLYKGGMPANYGGRLSSVLDVKMNEGNNQSFHTSGSIGLIAAKLNIEGPIQKDKSSFLISGRRTYADVFTAFSKNPSLKDNKLYFYDLNAKMNYSINDKNKIYASGYFGRDYLKINKRFGLDWGNITGTLRWNHIFSNRLFSNTSFIVSAFDYEINIKSANNDIHILSQIKDYNLKQEFQWNAGTKHAVKFGFNSVYHIIRPGEVTTSENSSYNNFYLQKRYSWDHAVFVTDNWKLSSKANVTFGLRASSFSIYGPGSFYVLDEERNVTDTLQYQKGQSVKNYLHVEPRVAFSYIINKNNSIKLSYVRNTQNLHLIANSSASFPTDKWVPSSNTLKPEIADLYAVGFYKNFDNNMFELSTETYYKSMQNQLDYKPGADAFGIDAIESQLLVGKGRAYGAELLIKKLKGKLTGWVGYTLSRTERKITGINDGEWYKARQDRTHDISIVALYQINKKWNLSGTWVYYTGDAVTYPAGRYVVDDQIVYYFTKRNQYRMPNYHRLDIAATVQLKKTNKFSSELSFGVYNIYGRQNAYVLSFKQDEKDKSKTQVVSTALFKYVPSISYNFKF